MKSTLNFNPPAIGHRGACGYAPENTIVSFAKAAQLGVKWVEFDVMQSSDGELIIFHDEMLDRTTNGHGDVSHYPYSYLRMLDAGAWFDLRFSSERIPTLRTVIDFLKNANLFANVEIKTLPGDEDIVVKHVIEQMASELATANNHYLFSSFSLDALASLRKYAPDCQLGLLLHDWEPGWQSACSSLNCISVHVFEEIMTAEAAREIKAMGKSLLCYTVNDPSRAAELFSWGVDAVFSDVPDQILSCTRAKAINS